MFYFPFPTIGLLEVTGCLKITVKSYRDPFLCLRRFIQLSSFVKKLADKELVFNNLWKESELKEWLLCML